MKEFLAKISLVITFLVSILHSFRPLRTRVPVKQIKIPAPIVVDDGTSYVDWEDEEK